MINLISSFKSINISEITNEKYTIILSKFITTEDLSNLEVLFKKYPSKNVVIHINNPNEDINRIDELLSVIKGVKITISDRHMYCNEPKQYFSKRPWELCGQNDYNAQEYQYEQAIYTETIQNIETKYKSIIERYDNIEFTLNNYGLKVDAINIKRKNQIFDKIVEDARKLNFSPLEAYLYFYSIVKLFKEYKGESNNEHPEISRQSEFILFNEYIVCAGYTRILTELVDRYNDSNLITSVYICYPNKTIHARNIVGIYDEKYNISNEYISDITADSKTGRLDMILDKTDCFLMTKEEIDKIDKRSKDSIPDCTDVWFYNQNGSNPISKDFPMFAWKDAEYFYWKRSTRLYGEYDINSLILSDPLEVRQKPINQDTIMRAHRNILTKTFNPKSKVRPILEIYWLNHVLLFNSRLQDKLKLVSEEKQGRKH